jgi:hypothetical protein
MRRSIGTWEFTNANGERIVVEADIDDGQKLQNAVLHLARRARGSAKKEACSMGGAFRVRIVSAAGGES